MRQFFFYSSNAWSSRPAALSAATELKRAPRKLVDLAIFNLQVFLSSLLRIKSSDRCWCSVESDENRRGKRINKIRSTHFYLDDDDERKFTASFRP